MDVSQFPWAVSKPVRLTKYKKSFDNIMLLFSTDHHPPSPVNDDDDVTSLTWFGSTLSSKVVIHQRFPAACSTIGKLRSMFHLTAPDALKIELVKTIAAYALESLPLNPTTSNVLDAGHRQLIQAALSISWHNNLTNEEVYAKSGLLPFSQAIRKRWLRLIGHSLCLQSWSVSPLGSMLQNLSVFSIRRGQSQTWTLAKDLLNDLNAINDIINFSSSLL